MNKLRISVAVGDYDRTRPLVDGRVQVDGADPVYMLLTPEEMFFRSMRHESFDVCELSFSSYAVRTAREPGARFAPLAFLSGKLFSADIGTVYESLALPVWASHGTRGDFTDYRAKRLFEGRPNWRFDVFEGGALPYFEHRAEFAARWRGFLGGG